MAGPFAVYTRDDGTWELRPALSGGGIGQRAISTNNANNISAITVSVTTTLTPWTGHRIVFLDGLADYDVTLPGLASMTLGAQITFIRTSGTGVPRILKNAVTDGVNGLTSVSDTEYYIRSLGQAVHYIVVPGSWACARFGDQADEAVTTAANPINIPSVRGGTLHLFDSSAVAGTVITLLGSGLVPEGCRYLIRNTDTSEHVLTPAVGDTINGAANLRVPRDAVVLVEQSGTSDWLALGGDPSPSPLATGANIVNLSEWLGTRIIRLTGGGGFPQNVILPTAGLMRTGDSLVIVNDDTRQAAVSPSGGEQINGDTALSYPIPPRSAVCITAVGSVGWSLVGSIRTPARISSAVDVTLTTAIGPQFVETTGAVGQNLTLPDATVTPLGAEVWMWNSSANAHVITAFAGDNILGAPSQPVVAGSQVYARYSGNQTWFAIQGP